MGHLLQSGVFLHKPSHPDEWHGALKSKLVNQLQAKAISGPGQGGRQLSWVTASSIRIKEVVRYLGLGDAMFRLVRGPTGGV